MRELMIEAEYAPFAPDWFLKTASRWFTVQKTPCLQTAEAVIGEPTPRPLTWALAQAMIECSGFETSCSNISQSLPSISPSPFTRSM